MNKNTKTLSAITLVSMLGISMSVVAQTDDLVIDAQGSVGVGTDVPNASLHVLRNDGTAKVMVDEADVSTARRTLMELKNNGAPQMLYTDTNTGAVWELNPNVNGNFLINSVGQGTGAEFTLTASNGNLRIAGDMRATNFIMTSSRAYKEGFKQVDSREVLDRVVALPITEWNFKDKKGVRHIGPTAEDFKDTFGLGAEDKRISMIDSSGVALAAIKGLKAEKDAELAEKDQQIAALKTELQALRQMVSKLITNDQVALK